MAKSARPSTGTAGVPSLRLRLLKIDKNPPSAAALRRYAPALRRIKKERGFFTGSLSSAAAVRADSAPPSA